MTSIANLSVAIAGLTTIGGMVYGGYELLKDVPKPVTELLKIKKKVLLDKDGDTEVWKQRWQQYIEANTTTKEIKPTDTPSSGSPAPQTPSANTVQKTINEQDFWGLSDWKDQKDKPETVPVSFKNKCQEKNDSQLPGIWTDEYKKFEKYCTKDAPSDD